MEPLETCKPWLGIRPGPMFGSKVQEHYPLDTIDMLAIEEVLHYLRYGKEHSEGWNA